MPHQLQSIASAWLFPGRKLNGNNNGIEREQWQQLRTNDGEKYTQWSERATRGRPRHLIATIEHPAGPPSLLGPSQQPPPLHRVSRRIFILFLSSHLIAYFKNEIGSFWSPSTASSIAVLAKSTANIIRPTNSKDKDRSKAQRNETKLYTHNSYYYCNYYPSNVLCVKINAKLMRFD